MGLLAYITNHYSAQASSSAGLLNRALDLLRNNEEQIDTDEDTGVPLPPESSVEAIYAAFDSFAEETGIDQIAVLVPSAGSYRMFFSHGFSAETVQKSESTCDFWDGTLCTGGNDWNTFGGENLVHLRQFFSEQEEIAVVHVKKITDENVPLIFIMAENSPKKKIDLDSADIVIPSLLSEIRPLVQSAAACKTAEMAADLYTHFSTYIFKGM